MKNIKVKKVMPRIAALLFIPFIISGCTQRSDCELPSRHVHLYTMNTNKGKVSTYLDNEALVYQRNDWKGDAIIRFNWNKDYMEITKEDEAFYRIKGDSFEGVNNWEYLFNTMKENSKDYLEFYYHYTTTSYAKVGKTTVPQTHHHSGWDSDPEHRGVTGEVRLCHNRFYGYNIYLQNGQYVKVKSPLVDDIREIINDYPYFDSDCVETVYKEYDYTNDTSILPKLKVSDFNYFNGPDLDNSDINGYQK